MPQRARPAYGRGTSDVLRAASRPHPFMFLGIVQVGVPMLPPATPVH